MHVLSTAKFEAQWQFASGITGVAGDIAGEKFSGAVAVESPEISSLTLSAITGGQDIGLYCKNFALPVGYSDTRTSSTLMATRCFFIGARHRLRQGKERTLARGR